MLKNVNLRRFYVFGLQGGIIHIKRLRDFTVDEYTRNSVFALFQLRYKTYIRKRKFDAVNDD
jgi:hypothetical protein